jgi:hypothetical protein
MVRLRQHVRDAIVFNGSVGARSHVEEQKNQS